MPASYPNATFTPSAKATGNVIQVTHVTDLDNEVVAIENDLRTGLSNPLVVSAGGITQSQSTGVNSFAGTLQVTGNSTFGANVSIAGNSTIAGSLVVTGGLTAGGQVFGARTPSARVSLAANSSITQGAAFNGINWTTNDFDSTGIHSTSVNSSRMKLTSSGLWLFGGLVIMDAANSTSRIGARVLVNDATAIMGMEVAGLELSTQRTIPLSGQWLATDTASYLTVQMRYIGGGVDSTLYGSSGSASGIGQTHFWVTKISA